MQLWRVWVHVFVFGGIRVEVVFGVAIDSIRGDV